MKHSTSQCLFLIVISLFLVSGKSDDRTERFLIDSTDNSGSRLVQLDSSVQILMQTVNRLNNSVTELLSRNALLGNANRLQDNLIHQLQATISGLQLKDIQYQTLISSLENKISQQPTIQPSTTSTSVADSGSLFIRWGSRGCPKHNVDIVYSGYAGGQQYSGTGGPAGMLCLPTDPDINNTTSTIGSSYIYGMEYETNIFKSDANNEDVPCALCRSQSTVSSVMIPGRMTCYRGWKREYYGLLSSGATGHTSSDYICVDINPEYTPAGKDNKDGKRLYVASPVCGSLPCPPYKEAIPLYCVVCSK